MLHSAPKGQRAPERGAPHPIGRGDGVHTHCTKVTRYMIQLGGLRQSGDQDIPVMRGYRI